MRPSREIRIRVLRSGIHPHRYSLDRAWVDEPKPPFRRGPSMDAAAHVLSDDTAPVVTEAKGRAIGELYRRYWPELCRYLARTFGDGPPDPQDVAQQAFLRYATLDSQDAIRNERAYLYRIAHNVLIEEHRQGAVRRAAIADMATQMMLADEITPERALIAHDCLFVLHRVIQRLPPARRRSFLLHRIEGLSCAAIARRTGYSESAIKKHVALVTAALDEALRQVEGRESSPSGHSPRLSLALAHLSDNRSSPSTLHHHVGGTRASLIEAGACTEVASDMREARIPAP
jgi:RNA polymerase sigma factor (sigma-70 family)